MSSPDIFLSYNREDSARAKQFAEAFQAEGFEVWWDAHLRSGEEYDRVTEAALRDAKSVVVLWSKRSVDSSWVRAEATQAYRAKKLMPAMIEDCVRPVMFELTQTAELSQWKGNRKDSAWQAFVEDLRRTAGGEVEDPAVVTDLTNPSELVIASKPAWRSSRGLTMFAGAVLAILALAAIIWLKPLTENVKHSDQPVQISDFASEGGPQSELLAVSLKSTVQQILSVAGFTARSVGQPSGTSGFALLGTTVASEGRIKVFVQLEYLPSGETVWSRQFEDALGNVENVATAAAVAAVEALYSARHIDMQDGLDLTARDYASFIEGESAVNVGSPGNEGRPLEIFENLVDRVPRSAAAHAMLALVIDRSTPEGLQRSRAEIAKAIRLDPAAAGAAFDARYGLTRSESPNDLVRGEDALLDGLRQAANFAYLSMRECDLLMTVGRIAAAREYCVRAVAMRPTTAPVAWRMARVNDLAGQPGLARRAIDQALRYNPESTTTRFENFRLHAFGDTPGQALPLLSGMLDMAWWSGEREIAAYDSFLRARISEAQADRDSAAADVLDAAKNGSLLIDFAVPALAQLGHRDLALDLLESLEATDPRLGLGLGLFSAQVEPMWIEPRLWRFAERRGLVTYWKVREIWPDFCGKEIPLVQCQQLADEADGHSVQSQPGV